MFQGHIPADQYFVLVHVADQPFFVCHHIQLEAEQLVDRHAKISCQ